MRDSRDWSDPWVTLRSKISSSWTSLLSLNCDGQPWDWFRVGQPWASYQAFLLLSQRWHHPVSNSVSKHKLGIPSEFSSSLEKGPSAKRSSFSLWEQSSQDSFLNDEKGGTSGSQHILVFPFHLTVYHTRLCEPSSLGVLITPGMCITWANDKVLKLKLNNTECGTHWICAMQANPHHFPFWKFRISFCNVNFTTSCNIDEHLEKNNK